MSTGVQSDNDPIDFDIADLTEGARLEEEGLFARDVNGQLIRCRKGDREPTGRRRYADDQRESELRSKKRFRQPTARAASSTTPRGCLFRD